MPVKTKVLLLSRHTLLTPFGAPPLDGGFEFTPFGAPLLYRGFSFTPSGAPSLNEGFKLVVVDEVFVGKVFCFVFLVEEDVEVLELAMNSLMIK